MTTIGYHCILELSGCPSHLLNDQEFITEAVREAARTADLTLLGEISHGFTPQGVTALALLSESHISVHTWPELGYAAADVFTCGRHAKPGKACEYLARRLGAREHHMQKIRRGQPNPGAEARPARALDHRIAGCVGTEAAVTVPEPDSDEACLCPARDWTRLSG